MVWFAQVDVKLRLGHVGHLRDRTLGGAVRGDLRRGRVGRAADRIRDADRIAAFDQQTEIGNWIVYTLSKNTQR